MISTQIPESLALLCSHKIEIQKPKRLADLRLDELVNSVGLEFTEFVKSGCLNEMRNRDPTTAFAQIDIPKTASESIPEPIYATAIFHLLNNAMFMPVCDTGNNLPYTIYKCTAENASKMKDAGIRFYTPNEKLGYHNDVFHQSGRYYLPRFVSILNLFIGYHSPGSFHFVDKRRWSEFADIVENGKRFSFSFRPTPVVYESKLENQKELEDYRSINAFWTNEEDQSFAFCNGELKAEQSQGSELISTMQHQMSATCPKDSLPQRTLRIMLFRNDLGFHSRDIFKDQFILNGTTRLFVRACSRESESVPSIK